MANVSVDTNVSNIVVSTSQSNITVSDDGVIISNITVLESNINVGTTQNIINVAEVAAVSDADVRAALGNTAPILYNVSTGIFSFDSNAAFSGKTTDDLAEGSTNLYFTDTRVDNRVPTSILNSNITLKQYRDTVFDNGNISGNVTINVANGAMHKANITGNITGINVANVAAGTSLLVVLEQDAIGLAYLDTTTFASNWTNWKFVNDDTALNAAPNGVSYLGIVYDGEYYHLSVLTDAGGDLIPNSQLANSNVIINGITIPLGSSATLTTANIAENTNLYFTAARARGNVSATDAGGLGSFTYSSANGVFTYSGPSDSDVRNLLSSTSPITYSNTTGIIGLSGTASITTTGNISGGFILGNGSLLTGLPATYSNASVANFLANGFGSNNITTTGTISVGTLTSASACVTIASGKNLRLSGTSPTIIGDETGASQNATIRFDSVNVVIGDDSTADRFAVKHKTTGNTLFQVGSRIAGSGSSDADADVRIFGNVYVGAEDPLIDNSNAYIKKDGEIYGRILNTLNHVIAGGNISAPSGNISTNYFLGNGSLLTGITTVSNAQVVAYIATQPLTVGGNLDVNGNINATGNINYQNVTDLYVTDQKITLNSNAATNSNVEIISNRPTATNTMLKWNEQSTRWEFTNNGTTYYPIPASTSDLAEGTNLYYTTQRVRSNISVTVGSPSGNGNLSYDNSNGVFTFTPADTSAAGTVTQINTGENLTGGPITATGTIGMANALANVSTITAEATKNIVLNTANALVTQQKYNNTDVFSGNVSSDGYAFFRANNYAGNAVSSYSGVANIENFVFNTGNTTVGSNAITGVSLYQYVIGITGAGIAANISNVAVNSMLSVNEDSPYPFPQNTVVTSVDAANSTIYMSASATASVDLTLDVLAFFLHPVLLDTTTGQAIAVYSEFDVNGSGSKTTLINSEPLFTSKYAYPKSGFNINDFDVITAGVAGNYTLGNLTNNFIGRNKVESPTSVFQAPRGFVVGNADLSGRAENDSLPSFGINVLWDGLANVTTDYAGNAPNTQLLLKQYSDNSGQATNPTTFGPRLFFTSARGNKNLPYTETYPRKNDELGRITWWGSTQTLGAPGTLGPPAWISGVAGQDHIDTNSGVGMYFGISPNSSTENFNRSLYLASTMGNTLIASAQDSTGTHRPIIFAPSYVASSQGNSVLLYNQTINGSDPNTTAINTSGAHFAQINYNNTGALTGSKLAVTNGNNSTTQREGDLVLSIDRNYTSANANVRVRTGQTNYYGGTSPDRIRFAFTPNGLVDGTAVTINNFVNTTVAAALNGNVFYVKANTSGGLTNSYELYYDSGLTSGVNLGVSNVTAGPGTVEYTRNNGVTPKDWSFVLAQGSNSLVLTEDGGTRVTFEGSNVTTIGTVNAAYFVGDGSGLTNIPITYSNINVQQYLAFGLGSNNINTTGNITAGYFLGDGSQLTGINTSQIAEGANLWYTVGRANTAIDNRVTKSFVEGLGVSYTSLTDKPVIPTHTSNLTNDSGFITTATANVISVNTKTGTVVLNTGDIAESGNLYFTTARARQSISGAGDISYDANTGVISYIGTPGDITDVIAGDGLTGGGSTGNVTLNVGAGTGITVNADNIAVNMSAFSTTDLVEGANLYYTSTRANSAIDTRVNKAFVEGLGVSYTSLTDKPTIPTHTSNLTNDSGFITTATANVVSVNGETGVVVLDTGDIAEGANLYYTTTRANSAIDTRVNKSFVEGLGVSYTSLTDKPVIPTHTSNLVNDSGFITTANANVVSVNGETGVVSLDTTDIPEGANLYYTSTRANTAIDTRVNKAFVEALNVSYTSLANTPTNVSAFTNDAGYLVAANLVSLTANVNSVNGQTGTVILNTTNIAEGANLYFTNTRVQNYIVDSITTSDIDEGANLYYTTDRANSAIGAYQGSISTTGNIATTGNINAGYYFGNGAFLTGITSSYGDSNVTTLLANFGSNTISTTGNITAGNTIVNGVSFNTAGTTSPSSGQIVFNSNYGTHQVGLTGSNVMLMGQDLVVYARNDEANTLSKGEVVYIAGASGDKATIKRAINNNDNNSATTIGIVKSDISSGQLGYVVSQGVVDGLNLGGYTAGDKLYLGNVAGTFTNVKPQSPEHYVFIGVVERANPGNGQVLVRVQNGFEVDEIHDINVTNAQPNDILIRNSGNTLWINQNFNSTANAAIAAYQGNINTAGTLRANSVTVHGTTNVSLQVYDNTLGTSSGGMYFNVGGVTDVNAGFGVLRPVAGAPTFLLWNEATDKWQFTNDGSTFYNMATSTTDLAEGANLYYSNTRVNAFIQNNITTTDIDEGANLYFSNARVVSAVESSNITLKQFQETRVNLGSTGGNITLNMANGSIFAMTATSSISNIALSNAGVGASGTLIITQDGTGGKTLTTTSAWKFAGASKTLSTAANAIDIISFFTDGTTVYAALSKGYA